MFFSPLKRKVLSLGLRKVEVQKKELLMSSTLYKRYLYNLRILLGLPTSVDKKSYDTLIGLNDCIIFKTSKDLYILKNLL